MNNLIVSLLSLLLGAVIGGVAKALQDRYAKFEESRVVAAALRVEISIIIDSIRRGGYIELLDKIIAYLSNPKHVVRPDDFMDLPASQGPSPIFNAHCAQIGLLGGAVESVVRTYMLYEMAALDLRFLPERHKRQPLTREQLMQFHKGLKRTFEEIVRSGEVAMHQLQQRQAEGFIRRWWQH